MDLTNIKNPKTAAPAASGAKTTRVLPEKLSAKTLSPEGYINKPAKKAAADPGPKGPGRDTDSMLARMKDRLVTEQKRLANTELRARQHNDKAGSKKVAALAAALEKVIAKFD